jgi:hypothetical protein
MMRVRSNEGEREYNPCDVGVEFRLTKKSGCIRSPAYSSMWEEGKGRGRSGEKKETGKVREEEREGEEGEEGKGRQPVGRRS